MLEHILRFIKKFIPRRLFSLAQPAYHFTLAFLGALAYRFPSRNITVVAVTGTKGKTTTIELMSAILEEAGYKTALSSTLRFKIADHSDDNLRKMSTPGRFFVQKFLRRAVAAGCEYAILEVTSEAAKQFRHRFIAFDAFIFTNLSPEHIEAHGSYERYRDAKLSIGRALVRSKKPRRVLIVNKDDKEAEHFLALRVPEKHTYALSDAKPYTLAKEGIRMHVDGKEVSLHLSGTFNIYNTLAAISFAKTQGVHTETIVRALESFRGVRGRMEPIDEGQDFTVIVDYAHTPDSLEKVYEVFQNAKKICVLGGTGGGRDTWKRPEMGAIASRHCSHIILTDEDPYDEDPEKIVADIKKGIDRPIAEIIMDRRAAIKKACTMAETGDVVLITGKGTDPYIMGPHGTKTPWNDAQITREELKVIMAEGKAAHDLRFRI